MNKREKILKRQKILFDLVSDWNGIFFLSDEMIMKKMPEYSNYKTVRRDINMLEDKFLLSKKIKWTKTHKRRRYLSVVKRKADIRWQSDSNYLEEMVKANPDCFLIQWRIGYDHDSGGINKYINVLEESRGVTCTGVKLLSQPNNMLSSRPVRYKVKYVKDDEAIGEDRDEAIPF